MNDLKNEAKEYLNQIRNADREIDYQIQKLADVHASFLKSPTFEKDKVQSSRNGSFDDKYVKYIELQELVNDKIDELWELKKKVDEQIAQIDDYQEALVLRYRYILNKPWKEIAHIINRSEGHVLKVHGCALQSFQKKVLSEMIDNDSK